MAQPGNFYPVVSIEAEMGGALLKDAAVKKLHAPDCPFYRAANCPVGIECDHGYDVCPICDPCTCTALEAV